MRALLWLLAGFVWLGAASAFGQGPVNAPIPPNPCIGGKPLKLVWIANEIVSDAGIPGGPGFGETMVVCNHTGKTGQTTDVYVELFDFGGIPVGSGFACKVGVDSSDPNSPGAGVAFTTGAPIPPYLGIPVGPAIVSPPGSLRILASKPKVACDVTVFDTFGPFSGFSPGPMWSKDVTLTKAKAPQKGD
jgi:hypothetical protein